MHNDEGGSAAERLGGQLKSAKFAIALGVAGVGLAAGGFVAYQTVRRHLRSAPGSEAETPAALPPIEQRSKLFIFEQDDPEEPTLVTKAAAQVLRAFDANGGIQETALAEKLSISDDELTPVMKTLVANQFVERFATWPNGTVIALSEDPVTGSLTDTAGAILVVGPSRDLTAIHDEIQPRALLQATAEIELQ